MRAFGTGADCTGSTADGAGSPATDVADGARNVAANKTQTTNITVENRIPCLNFEANDVAMWGYGTTPFAMCFKTPHHNILHNHFACCNVLKSASRTNCDCRVMQPLCLHSHKMCNRLHFSHLHLSHNVAFEGAAC
jgi:hypothetical protein